MKIPHYWRTKSVVWPSFFLLFYFTKTYLSFEMEELQMVSKGQMLQETLQSNFNGDKKKEKTQDIEAHQGSFCSLFLQ